MYGRIKPAKQRFAFGVHFVIHLHHVARDLFGVSDAGKPRIQTLAGACRDLQHFGIGKFLGEFGLKSGEGVRLEEIGFVDDDQVGFLELFAVDINDLLGKLSAFAQSKHTRRAHGIN